MNNSAADFKNLIESKSKILITTHISPDPDAICSLLLLGRTLQKNYPSKVVKMVSEDEPEGLNFIPNYDEISFGPLLQLTEDFSPDLFIMVDANNYERCSRRDGSGVRQYTKERDVKTIVIDHHEPTDKDQVDLFINQGSVAASQDVYELLFQQLSLHKPEGFADTTLAGIYADTGGLVYLKKNHRQVLEIVSALLDDGANLEAIRNQINHYSDDHIKIFEQLMKNLDHQSDYTFSFISDDFALEWLRQQKKPITISTACSFFVNDFIRNIGDRKWGFTLYPDLLMGEGNYSVSFRSLEGKPDVAEIAGKLGGGGHKPSAGAKFPANSLQEALIKVHDTIAQKSDI